METHCKHSHKRELWETGTTSSSHCHEMYSWKVGQRSDVQVSSRVQPGRHRV